MNKNQIIQTFSDFVVIESVSTDRERFKQILKAVQFLKNKLESLNFKVNIFTKDKACPLIIAQYSCRNASHTIGIYGHYDVQPEDPVSEWQTKPFNLTLRKGKFWGRGTADNKGHIVQNLSAIESLINGRKLTNNIIFVLEGEEESGSVNFEHFVKKAENILQKIDVFYVIDMGMHEKDVPQIFYGLRGLVYFELKVTIGKRDLHSGVYGNSVYNPIQVIAELLAKIKDSQTGRILIPHFYDKVRERSRQELNILKKVAVSDTKLAKEAGVYKILSQGDYPSFLSSKILPSFDINGIISGHTGEGSKTIIPYSASAKFSFRLVEHQKAEVIEKIVKDFITDNLPMNHYRVQGSAPRSASPIGIKYELIVHSKADPFYCAINNEYIKKTAGIMAKTFANETLFNRTGGSVPAAEVLQRIFNKPIILTGFTLPDDNLHSPNENFDEEMFWEGIEVLEQIYAKI